MHNTLYIMTIHYYIIHVAINKDLAISNPWLVLYKLYRCNAGVMHNQLCIKTIHYDIIYVTQKKNIQLLETHGWYYKMVYKQSSNLYLGLIGVYRRQKY